MKLTKEQVQRDLDADLRRIKILTWNATRKKSEFRCLDCGNEWQARGGNVRKGSGCPECALKRGAEKRTKWTAITAQQALDDVASGIQIDDWGGGGSHERCGFRCQICGNRWRTSWPGVGDYGRGCPNCARKRGAEKRTKWTARTAQQALDDANREIQIDDWGGGGSHQRCGFRCRKCQHQWRTTWIGIWSLGSGCPNCADSSSDNNLLYFGHAAESPGLYKLGIGSVGQRRNRFKQAMRAAGFTGILVKAVKVDDARSWERKLRVHLPVNSDVSPHVFGYTEFHHLMEAEALRVVQMMEEIPFAVEVES